jgi:hypothetical protein
MSNTEELRDKAGRVLGRITHSSLRAELRDAAGRVKGYYYPSSNETRDAAGRVVGKGNLLAALLR